jgi:O-antigen/teichoic acid export membrane protein
MNKFLKGSLLLTAAKILDLVVDLLNVAIISRVFTLSEYGFYSQIMITATFFASFINLGLPSSINFFLAKEERYERKRKYLSNIVVLVNIIGFLSFIILFCIKGYISTYFENPSLGEYAYVFCLLPWIRLGILLRDNVFIVMNKVSNAIFNRVVMSIVRISLPITMLLVHLTFSNYILLFLFIEVSLFIYVQVSILFLFKGISFKSINIKLFIEILRYSIPLGVALAVGTINIQFDKIIIGKYFNTEEFAIFVNMSREIPVSALSASIVTIIMPSIIFKMQKKQYIEVVDLWKKTISFSYFIISPIIAILLCLSQESIILLYSEKYLDGLNVFRIYILILYFRVIYFGMILNAAGQTKKILNSSLLSLVLNIILSIILINILGFSGPAWATLISTLLMALYQLKVTSKILKLKIRDLFPWDNILKVTIKDLSLVIIVIALKYFIFIPIGIPSIWSLIIATTLWVIITTLFYLRFMRKSLNF